MKKFAVVISGVALMVSVMLALGVNPFARFSATVSADDGEGQGGGQSDHALWGGGDTNLYCGVGRQKEPWQLHVSATTGALPGTLTIGFRDGDAISYNIPAESSFSATNAFGGVPDVDDVVQIAPEGGVLSALASALVRPGARDPFADDDEKDNFCLTKSGDPGTLGSPGPNPWGVGTTLP